MKGRRLILIACVILLSFAGVGYSSWSEDLNIKSLFKTGNINIRFENTVIADSELFDINADASEDVLDIYGAAAPGSSVLVEYDIYNDSSIPIRYQSCDEDLPDGITLDQNDTVIEPGEYLRGNSLTIEPGENEITLPFVQYNASDEGGWKVDLKISWNITIVEETVEPSVDMMNDNATVEDVSDEEDQQTESPDENVQTESSDENVPQTESSVTESTEIDSSVEAPSEDSAVDEDLSEATIESESVPVSEDENVTENNTVTDEGSEENVNAGEE